MRFDTTRTTGLTLTFGPDCRASLADPESRTDSRVLLVVLWGATGSSASLERFLGLRSFKVRMCGDPEKAAVECLGLLIKSSGTVLREPSHNHVFNLMSHFIEIHLPSQQIFGMLMIFAELI